MSSQRSNLELQPAGAVEKTLAPIYWLFTRAKIGFRVMSVIRRFSPTANGRLQKRLNYVAYSTLYKKNKTEDALFFNYGYVGPEGVGPVLELAPEDEVNRTCLQLYNRVAGAVDLRGKEVLEVGCGRGGGSSFVMRYLRPQSMTGLDLSDVAVEFCRNRHRTPGLSFVVGDAENLPFPEGSFDAVLNVESSHTYPSCERFLQEVARVLRPDGVLLFTDFRYVRDVDKLRSQMSRAGFDVLEEERITPDVLRALDLESDRNLARWSNGIPTPLRPVIPWVAATKGTQVYKFFATGHWEYYRLVLRKRREPEPSGSGTAESDQESDGTAAKPNRPEE